tara:strand:- start:404 stop:805 length:402 start_codon:yes stop_codon:yes gene_type:complete
LGFEPSPAYAQGVAAHRDQPQVRKGDSGLDGPSQLERALIADLVAAEHQRFEPLARRAGGGGNQCLDAAIADSVGAQVEMVEMRGIALAGRLDLVVEQQGAEEKQLRVIDVLTGRVQDLCVSQHLFAPSQPQR